MNDQKQSGFALLISAPNSNKKFVPLVGETSTISDKDGKKLWSMTIPGPQNNRGVRIAEVEIGLLTQRYFDEFIRRLGSQKKCNQGKNRASEKTSTT